MAEVIHKSKDNSIKMVLDEPEMLISLLKNFVPVNMLKEVQPSDIEDVSTRHLTLISEQKDSDTIKRINLKGDTPLFVIAIIEHEQKVYFRAPFKMLMYITLILDSYEKEVIKKARKESKDKNANPTLLKNFKYPPILPIVFYDGKSKWTASKNFLCRTEMSDAFERYIPKFEYELIDLNEYSVDDLAKYGDLLSVFLIFDKIKEPEDLENVLSSVPEDYIESVKENVPEHLNKLMSDVTEVLLRKIDVPQEEINDMTDKIHKKGVPEMFNIENYSVQETRRIARAEGRTEGRAEGRAEGKRTFARKLLARKRPISEIAEDTGLTIEEINKLAENSQPPAQ